MGKVVPASIRLEIAQERQSEKASYSELSRSYSLSYNTVRSICLAYEASGEQGLVPNYSFCGRRQDYASKRSFRLVRLIKHLHPGWGVPYITTRLREHYPCLALMSDRHYQRLLKAGNNAGKLPKPKLPKPQPSDKPRVAHDEWQVDAKERFKLTDGTECCYLNVTDTKSGALLAAKAFPPWQDQPSQHRND